jgi:hypothetical protein
MDEDRRSDELAAREQADFRAWLEQRTAYRVVIRNVGAATATDIRVDVTPLRDHGSDLGDAKLNSEWSLPALAPDQSCPFALASAGGEAPPYRVTISWRDPSSRDERRSTWIPLNR